MLWLTRLGGSAEQTAPVLAQLSERELLAASFDPPGHGRGSAGGEPWELAQEVLGGFRRRMWPLTGRSVLEPTEDSAPARGLHRGQDDTR